MKILFAVLSIMPIAFIGLTAFLAASSGRAAGLGYAALGGYLLWRLWRRGPK